LSTARSEMEAALQATTEMLSQVNRLLALVSAPPLAATTVRHVEVLLLQPQLVMAVVITSTGGVAKHLAQFEDPVDPGLTAWAAVRPRRSRPRGVRAPQRRARRRLLRPRAPHARLGQPDRPGADGLREGDSLRPRRSR